MQQDALDGVGEAGQLTADIECQTAEILQQITGVFQAIGQVLEKRVAVLIVFCVRNCEAGERRQIVQEQQEGFRSSLAAVCIFLRQLLDRLAVQRQGQQRATGLLQAPTSTSARKAQ